MARTKEFDPRERLDRAVSAFWQRGYDGLGVQQLCAAMDLFPGSLYATYGDKRSLFLNALDRYMATHSAQVVAILSGGASGIEALEAYFARLIEEIESGNRKWGCLITNTIVEMAQSEPEVRSRVDVHLARLETAFASAVARSQREGGIASGDPVDHAAYLVCLVQGLNVLAKTSPGRQRLETIVRRGLAPLRP